MPHEEVLNAYSAIKKVPYSPTLLEIARQSSKELVWSRLLAYFLDPERGPEISSIWLRAIFRLLELPYRGDRVEEVHLEVRTANNNLIDLVVITTDHVLAIENKVYAALYNDLKDYNLHCCQVAAAAKKQSVTAVLSVTPYSTEALQGFRNILWSRLQQEVKTLISQSHSAALDRQTIYQNEFLAMMESVMIKKKIDAEMLNFVVRHQHELTALFSDLEAMRDHLSTSSNEFQQEVKPYVETSRFSCRQYRERNNPLFAVTYFDIISASGVKIAVDVVFRPEGVTVEIFSRDRSKLAHFLPELFNAGVAMTSHVDGRQLWDIKFTNADEINLIATQVSALLAKIENVVA